MRRAKPVDSAGPPPPPAAASPPEPPRPLTPAEAAARIDAARDRLRARIEPPDPDGERERE
jgi:hypothetical protein